MSSSFVAACSRIAPRFPSSILPPKNDTSRCSSHRARLARNLHGAELKDSARASGTLVTKARRRRHAILMLPQRRRRHRRCRQSRWHDEHRSGYRRRHEADDAGDRSGRRGAQCDRAERRRNGVLDRHRPDGRDCPNRRRVHWRRRGRRGPARGRGRTGRHHRPWSARCRRARRRPGEAAGGHRRHGRASWCPQGACAARNDDDPATHRASCPDARSGNFGRVNTKDRATVGTGHRHRPVPARNAMTAGAPGSRTATACSSSSSSRRRSTVHTEPGSVFA